MSYDVGEKCAAIVNWAESEKDDFDLTFVEKIQQVWEENGLVTERQEEAIDNIIESFDIDVSEWK